MSTAPTGRARPTTTAATGPAASRRVEQMADWRGKRVLLVGDSLMYQAYDSIHSLLAVHGAATRFVGLSHTGLLTGQGWWLRHITTEVEAFRPEVVVIEACCNYGDLGPLYVDADGQAIQPDTEAMFRQWAASARAAVRRARAHGAKVYWVVTPDAGYLVSRNIQVRIHRFNDISAHLGVPRIDWRAALEPDGVYTTSMLTPDGFAVVRKDDSLHIAPAGNGVVAAATLRALQPALG